MTAHGCEVSVWGDGMLWNCTVVTMYMCQMSLYILGFVSFTTITPPPKPQGPEHGGGFSASFPLPRGQGQFPPGRHTPPSADGEDLPSAPEI